MISAYPPIMTETEQRGGRPAVAAATKPNEHHSACFSLSPPSFFRPPIPFRYGHIFASSTRHPPAFSLIRPGSWPHPCGMRRPLFTTFCWHITVPLLLFACSGALAVPVLKWQDLSRSRAYASYQISDGAGGKAEAEARAVILGQSLFPPPCRPPPPVWLRGLSRNRFSNRIESNTIL